MPLGSGRFERPGVIGDRGDDRGDRGGGLRDRLRDRRRKEGRRAQVAYLACASDGEGLHPGLGSLLASLIGRLAAEAAVGRW